MRTFLIPLISATVLAAFAGMANAQQAVILVRHTDTLPGLLKALGHPADITIEPQDYGNMFVLMPRSDGVPAFLRLRY